MDIIGAMERDLGHLLHHDTPVLVIPIGPPADLSVPTFTPNTQTSSPSQPEVPVSVLSAIHKDLSAIGQAAEHAWPQLTAIVTNPLLDELVEAALTAAGAGVAAETFQASIDAFKGAAARKAGTADQVAAAVDAGQQAAQAAAPAEAAQAAQAAKPLVV